MARVHPQSRVNFASCLILVSDVDRVRVSPRMLFPIVCQTNEHTYLSQLLPRLQWSMLDTHRRARSLYLRTANCCLLARN